MNDKAQTSAPAPHIEPGPVAPKPSEGELAEIRDHQPSNLTFQLASQLSVMKAPVSSPDAAAMVNTKPLAALAQSRKAQRNGRIARLPKIQRDMVNPPPFHYCFTYCRCSHSFLPTAMGKRLSNH